MQINVHGQATFFYFLSKEQAGIQFFLSLHRLPTFLYGVAQNVSRSLFLQFGNF